MQTQFMPPKTSDIMMNFNALWQLTIFKKLNSAHELRICSSHCITGITVAATYFTYFLKK